jgi:hypothetical protein
MSNKFTRKALKTELELGIIKKSKQRIVKKRTVQTILVNKNLDQNIIIEPIIEPVDSIYNIVELGDSQDKIVEKDEIIEEKVKKTRKKKAEINNDDVTEDSNLIDEESDINE